jgi:hypothetical protein
MVYGPAVVGEGQVEEAVPGLDEGRVVELPFAPHEIADVGPGAAFVFAKG